MGHNRIEVSKGDSYGWLTVIEEASGRTRANGIVRRMVLCQCKCGNKTTVSLDYLRKKNSSPACGCRRGGNGKNRKHGYARRHDPHFALYRVWSGMIARCYTESAGGYERYGGRGIGVCLDWFDPEEFINWALGSGWKKGLEIDRIDNDGDYTPSNCRIVTRKQNARNTRSTRRLMWNGETLSLVEWAERTGISYNVLSQRLNLLHWPVERALTEPVRARRSS